MTQIRDMAVVPVEPTTEMRLAGVMAWRDDEEEAPVTRIWEAMLAAAPQALANRDAPGLGSSAKADPHRVAEGAVVSGHTAKCWGRTSYSDEMAHCYCVAEPNDADTLATLLDNVVVAQSLSRELREQAHDQARSYLYDRRQRLAAPAINTTAGEAG